VRFKFSFDANDLAQSVNVIPDNWVAYIPNYKIIRVGIVRCVDPFLTVEEIFQGLKWLDRPVEIRSIERLKFKDKNKDNELRVSSSIKMEFVSSLLPEFISIWNVRSRVRPYINRVRKCFNCLRWGHSSVFCRGRSNCSKCGDVHDSENCQGDSFHCPDCGQIHSPFNFNCPVFLKYQLINQVMAFCNTSQYNAKRLIKSKNIVDGNQVEKLFKSSAYLAWKSVDILSNFGNSESSSTPSIVNSKVKNLRRHKVKHGKSFVDWWQ